MLLFAWASMSLFLKILWCVTLSASLIFVIQSIMTFIGIGGDADLDAGGDVDVPDSADGVDGADGADPGMNLYTFRNLINFLLGFGWTAIICYDKIASTALLIGVALLVGVIFVAIVMYLFKWLWSMQASGNINVEKSAVGCEGKVYLTIPAERKGSGKVQITINDSVREYTALTDGDELKTGTDIKVTEVINGTTLVVEPINSLII